MKLGLPLMSGETSPPPPAIDQSMAGFAIGWQDDRVLSCQVMLPLENQHRRYFAQDDELELSALENVVEQGLAGLWGHSRRTHVSGSYLNDVLRSDNAPSLLALAAGNVMRRDVLGLANLHLPVENTSPFPANWRSLVGQHEAAAVEETALELQRLKGKSLGNAFRDIMLRPTPHTSVPRATKRRNPIRILCGCWFKVKLNEVNFSIIRTNRCA